MPDTVKPLILRVNAKRIARQVLRVGVPGILCVGVPATGEHAALVLIQDEQELNDGASATNACDRILHSIHRQWSDSIDVERAVVVQRDSEGLYDHVIPDWSRSPPRLEWRPLKWVGTEARSEQAFLGLYGEQARRTVAAIEAFLDQAASDNLLASQRVAAVGGIAYKKVR